VSLATLAGTFRHVVGFTSGGRKMVARKRITTEPCAISTLEDWPIGMLPDGTLNIVNVDDPPFKPMVIDNLGNLILNPDVEAEAAKASK
jgi:hypothetical protein